MTLRTPRIFSRRRVVIAGLSLPIPLLFGAACGDSDSDDPPNAATTEDAATRQPTSSGATGAPRSATSAASATAAPTLTPTPACTDEDDEPTVAQTEGPYFTPNSPERTSLLESGVSGTKLLLTGSVVTTACTPVARALVDFWQCDDAGVYDNEGYILRGHQFTDSNGGYRLETIVPGLYPGRTRHIHVKVQAPGGRVLTTQLYFPGEARNQQDGIYAAECLIEDYADVAGGKTGTFRVVLAS